MNFTSEEQQVLNVVTRFERPTPQLIESRVEGGGRIAQRIHSQGHLEFVPLPEGQFGLTFTPQAIDAFQIASEFPVCHPKHQARIRYAMAKFCEQKGSRIPLIPSDFRDKPDLDYPFIDHRSYYQEEDRLGFIVVDCAISESSGRRFLYRWMRKAREHLERPGFLALCDSGQFVVTAVTPSRQKADLLRRKDNHDAALRKQVRLHVAHLPELTSFSQ